VSRPLPAEKTAGSSARVDHRRAIFLRFHVVSPRFCARSCVFRGSDDRRRARVPAAAEPPPGWAAVTPQHPPDRGTPHPHHHLLTGTHTGSPVAPGSPILRLHTAHAPTMYRGSSPVRARPSVWCACSMIPSHACAPALARAHQPSSWARQRHGWPVLGSIWARSRSSTEARVVRHALVLPRSHVPTYSVSGRHRRVVRDLGVEVVPLPRVARRARCLGPPDRLVAQRA
jgi:hypothetical protein